MFGGPSLNALNPLRRAFVLQYIAGPPEVRGIAYKAYLAAGYNAANKNTASAAVYQVLQDEGVKLAIVEVRKAMDEHFKGQLFSWTEMAVKWQQLIIGYQETLAGLRKDNPILLSANAVATMKEVFDRALGKPTQPHEHEIGTRLDALIKELAYNKSNGQLVGNGHRENHQLTDGNHQLTEVATSGRILEDPQRDQRP